MNSSQNQLTRLGYEKGTHVEGTYSARMQLGELLPVFEIVQRIGALVAGAASKNEAWPVSGFIPAHPKQTAGTVLFACDPNRDGNPTPEECAVIVPELVDAYQEVHGPVAFGLEPVAEHFRVLPGLIEGYGAGSQEFTLDEALGKLPQKTRMDSGLSVVAGTVWSARYRRPDWHPYYYEAGLDLRGPEEAIGPVLQMAHDMHQDRIVFEITDTETQVIQRPREG